MADSWETPKWLMSMFDDYFDPCPLNEHWEVDGLQLEWKDKTYVNPPYSNPKPWVKKAIEESKKGKRIVMLLNCDPSTEWFSLLNQENAHFLWFAERLKFLENGKEKGANNKPNMLVILSDDYLCKKEEYPSIEEVERCCDGGEPCSMCKKDELNSHPKNTKEGRPLLDSEIGHPSSLVGIKGDTNNLKDTNDKESENYER